MTHKTPKSHHCPNTQEPRIAGNSGNTGNGLAHRGFQPLPPYKKSGNNWQRTPDFHYKSASLPHALLIAVASVLLLATVASAGSPVIRGCCRRCHCCRCF